MDQKLADYLDRRDTAPDLTGDYYLEFLSRIHNMLRPKTYLEIGSRTGDSLELAHCASIAIDPGFNLHPGFMGTKALCALYQMTSDSFFASIDPKQVLGAPIDFAFLDGMHLAEFLLRDFMNTEKHCRNNSVIAMHDCIPVELPIARRIEADAVTAASSIHPHWWTGDVWKTVVVLKKYRPDLRIYAVDASPTGIIMITNLDQSSDVLSRRYFEILDELRTMDLATIGVQTYCDSLNIIPTQSLTNLEDFAQRFWL